MPQIRIPTADVQPDGRVLVSFGKHGFDFPNVADANREIDDRIDNLMDQNFLKWMAMYLAKKRPGLRGKTLVFDLTAATKLMTVS